MNDETQAEIDKLKPDIDLVARYHEWLEMQGYVLCEVGEIDGAGHREGFVPVTTGRMHLVFRYFGFLATSFTNIVKNPDAASPLWRFRK